MKKQSREVYWSRENGSIFEKFALELQEFMSAGAPPSYADQDMRYALELQEKRLKEKGLRLKYEFIPRGIFADGGGLSKGWHDERYTSTMEYRTCNLTRTIYQGKEKLYDKDKDLIFYQTLTNVYNMDVVGSDLYGCPNCGAPSRIDVLQMGCPYCGTFFEMSDLFPKVTNFFFVEDSGSTTKELKGEIKNFMIPCAVISAIGFSVYFFQNPGEGNSGGIGAILQGIFSGVLFGIIGGYFMWAFHKLFTVFKNAAKSLPMVTNTMGSEKRFVSLMQKYSPEFSYEYFSNKVVSMLKTVMFSEQPEEFPNYGGTPLGDTFCDVVDASYSGATALKAFQVKENICRVTVDVYMEDLYERDGRIRKEDETFRIVLRKNVSKPIDYYFSIKKISCRGCGSSFDATKQRTCPACGKRYEIGDDDWVMEEIEKLR